jgi:hypothetical protein
MEAGAHYPDDLETAVPRPSRAERARRSSADARWIAFAGAYLAVAGGMSIIWGIVALGNKSAFKEDGLVWSSLSTWGTLAIVVGGLEVIAGLLLLGRQFAGQWLAGVLAVAAIFVHFLALGAYPVWSVIAIVANGLVLWAITAHGEAIE